MTRWSFTRVGPEDVAGGLTATLRIRSGAQSFHCSECVSETGVGYPVMYVPFHFETLEAVDGGCEGLLAAFLDFILAEVGNFWCPRPLEEQDVQPLADVVAKVPVELGEGAASTPASEASVGSRSVSESENGRRLRTRVSHAKRRLLRRSVAAMKSQEIKDFALERAAGVGYENYDIVTDEHLFDVLDLFATCHSGTARLNLIDVTTGLGPTICYRHDDSFKFHIASMKNRSRHLLDAMVGRLRNAVAALRSGFLQRRWAQLTQALKIPEFKQLLRTGLYSPQYLDRQITEVWDTLDNSIARGFEKPF
eukprot:Protomagalhaensia_wolfi_Nauph_80__3449@NODE_349_length_2712_cov_12_925552_g262_i0_p2_GENE_NODE_349_length_2712_cov_12_925552_g262_i0NODE_349_length_2712_cov_12_925552_g262_i0_p2_ORF_typecomplete_len308_score39_06_NODE_349_length_2712_cov_12_925552_g262_i017322655